MGVKGYPIGENWARPHEWCYAPHATLIGGWFTGWKYRKAIPASRASGAVSNYQMKLVINRSAGTDAAGTIYVGDRCASDYSDIRFTSTNGCTLLDYWIESNSSTTATVWIELDSVPTSSVNYYFYCGATASSLSSGANTFIVFDDFERGANGDTVGGIWTETTAHVHISTEQAYSGTRCAKLVAATGTNPKMTISDTNENIAVQMMVWKEPNSYIYFIKGAGYAKIAYCYINNTEDLRYNDGSDKDSGINGVENAWQLVELKNFNWSTLTYSVMINTNTVTGLGMLAAVSSTIAIYIDGATGVDSYIDNFIVRQYLATEPAWGTPGAWEVF